MQKVWCPYDGVAYPIDGLNGYFPHVIREHPGSPEYVEILRAIHDHAEQVAAELRQEARRQSPDPHLHVV